jgi:hypothetical protein
MKIYSDEDERAIRAGRLAKDWERSALLDAAQYARIKPGCDVDLRRTNLFLRLTLLGFGMLIIGAAVGLVMLTAGVDASVTGGVICLAGAAVSAAAAELLVRRYRLYRFGIEEACVAASVVLVSIGSALLVDTLPDVRQLLVAAVAGALSAFAAHRRFGYMYAAFAAMACAGAAPFAIGESTVVHHLAAAVILGVCAMVARSKYRQHGDDYPGDAYAALQAAGVLGLYGVMNLHLFWFSAAAVPHPFYWFSYATIWIVPVLAFTSALRERDRLLLDASLVMALTTLATNKPYLGLERREWDPMLLGVFLIAAALILRRWLAAGDGGMRRGITASRILRSEKDHVALLGTASGFRDAPATEYLGAPPNGPFGGGGGRAGGGGADGSF